MMMMDQNNDDDDDDGDDNDGHKLQCTKSDSHLPVNSMKASAVNHHHHHDNLTKQLAPGNCERETSEISESKTD